jgi:acyl carrier protein
LHAKTVLVELPEIEFRRYCMTREEVFEHVKAILVETLSVDEDKVTLEARFQEDLETDSLDLVELVMTMEDKFDIKISDEEAAEIKTVGDAVDFVMGRLG